jgi:hypothetical protein
LLQQPLSSTQRVLTRQLFCAHFILIHTATSQPKQTYPNNTVHMTLMFTKVNAIYLHPRPASAASCQPSDCPYAPAAPHSFIFIHTHVKSPQHSQTNQMMLRIYWLLYMKSLPHTCTLALLQQPLASAQRVPA